MGEPAHFGMRVRAVAIDQRSWSENPRRGGADLLVAILANATALVGRTQVCLACASTKFNTRW